MTAVRGTFSDFKTVKTRGVCQLIIEVPIESADHALEVLGGVPKMKAEQWVGIAPIAAPETPQDARSSPLGTLVPQEPERPKGGPRSQRAGILCNTYTFQLWMEKVGWPDKSFPPDPPSSSMTKFAAEARETLLRNCFVGSMRHLDQDDSAGETFDQIERKYRDAMEGRTDPDLAKQAMYGP